MKDYDKDKKPKYRRPSYIVWWHPPGQEKVEDIPIYDKDTAKRDGAFYKRLYGTERGGYYQCGRSDERAQRERS